MKRTRTENNRSYRSIRACGRLLEISGKIKKVENVNGEMIVTVAVLGANLDNLKQVNYQECIVPFEYEPYVLAKKIGDKFGILGNYFFNPNFKKWLLFGVLVFLYKQPKKRHYVAKKNKKRVPGVAVTPPAGGMCAKLSNNLVIYTVEPVNAGR